MACLNTFDVFDIIGPVMIGPSSSHTAGVVRIGLVAGLLCNFEPKEITEYFYGSLASTVSVKVCPEGTPENEEGEQIRVSCF